jgi:hypothetical protein
VNSKLLRCLCVPIILLLCLHVQSCKLPKRFDDPEKQARYDLYLKEVSSVHSKYQQRLRASNVPSLQLLDSPEAEALEALFEGGLPPKEQMQKAKPLVERLLLRSVGSNDVLTQLPGMFVTRFCLQPNAIDMIKAEETEDADEEAQIDALCGWVNALNYDFPRVREFATLADALLSIIPEIDPESDVKPDSIKLDSQVIADALAPLLAQKRWAHSEQLLADMQLRAWDATGAAKTVLAPEEFKEFEVSGVDLVLGNFDGHFLGFEDMLRNDLYTGVLLSPCQESKWLDPNDSDPKDDTSSAASLSGKKNLQRVCRDLSLHVLQHTKSLDALEEAFELLGNLDGLAGLKASAIQHDIENRPHASWPVWVKQRHVEFEALKDIELLSDARDLLELKARLRFLSEHGSIALARRLHQGKAF